MISDDDLLKPLPRQYPRLSLKQRRAFFSQITGFAGVDPRFDDHTALIAEVTMKRHLVPAELIPDASDDSYEHFYRENSLIFKTYDEILEIDKVRKHAKQARMQAEWEAYQRRQRQEKQAESDRQWREAEERRKGGVIRHVTITTSTR